MKIFPNLRRLYVMQELCSSLSLSKSKIGVSFYHDVGYLKNPILKICDFSANMYHMNMIFRFFGQFIAWAFSGMFSHYFWTLFRDFMSFWIWCVFLGRGQFTNITKMEVWWKSSKVPSNEYFSLFAGEFCFSP